MNPDFLLSSYQFDLPEDRIAQQPAARREASRLMVLNAGRGVRAEGRFSDLIDFLPAGCLLVANNSRVIPARIEARLPIGSDGQGGGKVEALLLTPPPLLAFSEREGWDEAEADVLLRPAKKFPPGASLELGPDFSLTVLERGEFGRCRARLRKRGDLGAILARLGQLPLPPYIRRPEGLGAEDAERYQTTYARADKAGSAAAPTAGLHFTPELREKLAASGREWAEATLYVGYGTFSPVRCDDIREHQMHAEYMEISPETAEAVNRAKAEGRPIVAVGTTSARLLEGVYAALHDKGEAPGGEVEIPVSGSAVHRGGDPSGAGMPTDEKGPSGEEAVFSGGAAFGGLQPFAGWINIFLYPGKRFHVVDGLVTNFHLPGSSLLMMVSALAGREVVLEAYRRAVEGEYRFFSYGDAMLILP